MKATPFLVTSAGGTNGPGRDALLAFDSDGQLVGPFSEDARLVDPRGMSLDPSGEHVYVCSGDDRILAIDRLGRVVRDSGRIPALDPGGGQFGPDGRFYVTARRRRTIVAFPATLAGGGDRLLPERAVPFPRGFGFGEGGRLYFASGIGPDGTGENAIRVFNLEVDPRSRRLVTDPELSPLDLTVAPNGHIVVASEFPFGAAHAAASLREYDPHTGDLIRAFPLNDTLDFGHPRGVRFGPDGRVYCVGQDHVVAVDFRTGAFLGPVIELPRLFGQAIVLL